MLLCLRMREFPVDVNVGRICSRLGWIPLDVETAAEVMVFHSTFLSFTASCMLPWWAASFTQPSSALPALGWEAAEITMLPYGGRGWSCF